MIGRGAVALPAGSLLCIAAGLAVRYTAGPRPALLLWSAGLAVTGAPVVWTTIRTAAAGHFAADLVASFAIVGALLLGEPLAGLVVVLMQTGGKRSSATPRAGPPRRCGSWRRRRREWRTGWTGASLRTYRWMWWGWVTCSWCGRVS